MNLKERLGKVIKTHIYKGKVCADNEEVMLLEAVMFELRIFNKEHLN